MRDIALTAVNIARSAVQSMLPIVAVRAARTCPPARNPNHTFDRAYRFCKRRSIAESILPPGAATLCTRRNTTTFHEKMKK